MRKQLFNNMNKLFLFVIALSLPLIVNADVTFEVDKNLPAPTGNLRLSSSEQVCNNIIERYEVASTNLVATSISDSLAYPVQDVFFQCLVRAFADHRPIVLSPDMIWLVISQEFSHYVNQNSEELRDKIVFHKDGKIDLVTHDCNNDLLLPNADWQRVIEDFANTIEENTKSDIADMMLADFSTTGTTERIASGIVMMDAVKQYFYYSRFVGVCGIPYITLTGTSDDWQKVLDKTMRLDQFGLDWWTAELKPILNEFIDASNGKINKKFWKSIVDKYRPRELRGYSCSKKKPTELDGWFLKFFPFDHPGGIPKSVSYGSSMMDEMVRVPFTYYKVDGFVNIESAHQMELCAGFVGISEDKETYELSPQIGWIVRRCDSDEKIAEQLKERVHSGTLELRISKVPYALTLVSNLKTLNLYFVDKVEIPEWMDNIRIENLFITGIMTIDEETSLKQRFPNATITNRARL